MTSVDFRSGIDFSRFKVEAVVEEQGGKSDGEGFDGWEDKRLEFFECRWYWRFRRENLER